MALFIPRNGQPNFFDWTNFNFLNSSILNMGLADFKDLPPTPLVLCWKLFLIEQGMFNLMLSNHDSLVKTFLQHWL